MECMICWESCSEPKLDCRCKGANGHIHIECLKRMNNNKCPNCRCTINKYVNPSHPKPIDICVILGYYALNIIGILYVIRNYPRDYWEFIGVFYVWIPSGFVMLGWILWRKLDIIDYLNKQ